MMELPSPLSHAYLITGGSAEERDALAGRMGGLPVPGGAPPLRAVRALPEGSGGRPPGYLAHRPRPGQA